MNKENNKINIFLVGNGINLNLSNQPDEYNLLDDELIFRFFNLIGFNYHFYKDKERIFEKYKEWLIGPCKHDPNKKETYNFYYKMNKDILDFELIFQIYLCSSNFEDESKSFHNKLYERINVEKEQIVKKTPKPEKWPIKDEMNKEYDFVITTNYDLNLEESGVKNIYHPHGDINNPQKIKFATFMGEDEITKRIEDEITKKNANKIKLDIYGIWLYNEIHIINALLILKKKYKDAFEINQYIYKNDDTISSILLKKYYNIDLKEFDNTIKVLQQKYKIINFLKNKIKKIKEEDIRWFLRRKNIDNNNIDEIKFFKFILEICKSIKIKYHPEHFINKLPKNYNPPENSLKN